MDLLISNRCDGIERKSINLCQMTLQRVWLGEPSCLESFHPSFVLGTAHAVVLPQDAYQTLGDPPAPSSVSICRVV